MREILFKAKREDNGEWVEGYFIPDMIEKTHSKMIDWGFMKVFDYENATVKTVRIVRETLCQYTGLNDKNGNKIFEHDLVINKYENLEDGTIEVYFGNGKFVGKSIDGCDEMIKYDCEIIGNIHDKGEEV